MKLYRERTLHKMNAVLVALFFVSAISLALGMKCYECNVWKAGYGNLCDQPRVRDGCFGCMKTETTIFMGYYKNTPRYSTIVSRICANSRTVAFSHECQYYETVDGHSKRCYCNTDLCNGALPSASSAALPLLIISSAFITIWNFFHY